MPANGSKQNARSLAIAHHCFIIAATTFDAVPPATVVVPLDTIDSQYISLTLPIVSLLLSQLHQSSSFALPKTPRFATRLL